MRRFISLAILLLGVLGIKGANINIPYTTLEYNIHWSWGLINMDIATAHVTFACDNNELHATIAGHSVPWEGRVYAIADTLQARMQPNQSNIDYVIGWYRKPKVNSTTNQNLPSQYKNTLGQGTLNADYSTMECVDITANMLNVFYLAKALDFDNMKEGETIHIPLYYGEICQPMTLTYNGIANDEYSVTLEYSYGGRLSGVPVTVNIGTNDRLPHTMIANIHIGHVEMQLN